MRIISITDIYATNNSNHMLKTISLTEQLGLYTVSAYCYGNTTTEDFTEDCGSSQDLDEAIQIYKDNGGK